MRKYRLILISLPFIALVGGPLLGINLINGINIYFTDLISFTAFLFCIIKGKKTVKIIRKEIPVVRAILFFSVILLLSLLFSPLKLTLSEKMISGLYLVRFIIYFSLYIACKLIYLSKTIKPVHTTFGLVAAGLILSIIGWVQYFFYPDLRNLLYLGWDPHYMRIFSTYFDPNYLGLLIVLSLISISTISNSVRKIITGSVLLMTLAFTYSRSSYFSLFLVSVVNLIIRRKWLVSILIGFAFVLILFFLPRPYGNESVKLERLFTLHERVSQWNEAGDLIRKYPVLGIGFDALRYARRDLSLATKEFITGHSGAGVDNSFLFVGVTSGTAGLFFFAILLVVLYKEINYTAKLTLTAILIHSLFLNSFFLPFVMMWFWLTAAEGKEVNKVNLSGNSP